MMRVTAHFLLHSALFFSRLWSAPSAVAHRGLIRPAEGHHRSTALADSADVSAGEQGSSFAPEPDALYLGARAGRAGRTKRLPGSKPTSLDLTFHMLRELLETSRAESLSQRARFNQHLLKNLGKRAEIQ